MVILFVLLLIVNVFLLELFSIDYVIVLFVELMILLNVLDFSMIIDVFIGVFVLIFSNLGLVIVGERFCI